MQQQQPPWQSQQGQQVQQGQVVFMAQPNPAYSATNPGTVGYYPQGVPQVHMVGAQVIPYRIPKYDYVPQDFRTLTILTIVFCGLFSPLSLLFSIPGLVFANKSQNSARNGATKVARSQGMVAAYLNIAAILFALVVGMVLTGLVIGLYGKTWAFNSCYKRAEERYGPLTSSNGDGGGNFDRQTYNCY